MSVGIRTGCIPPRSSSLRSSRSSSAASSTSAATSPVCGSPSRVSLTGIVAAFVSAPISAIAFGGVTGGGTDLLVAALRQGGSDVLHASLGQGLFSDPIDKTHHELRRLHDPRVGCPRGSSRGSRSASGSSGTVRPDPGPESSVAIPERPRRSPPRLRPARPDRAIPRAEPTHEVRHRDRERGRRVRGARMDGPAQRARVDGRDRAVCGGVALAPAVRPRHDPDRRRRSCSSTRSSTPGPPTCSSGSDHSRRPGPA